MNSKYTGQEIETFLEQVDNLDMGNYALKTDVQEAIAEAITATLNTPV